MNLRSRSGLVRIAGLVTVLGLAACDSGSADAKKAEPAKAAADVKAAADKAAADAKAAADKTAADAKAAADKAAADIKAAADGATAGAATAGDAKAPDAAATAGDVKPPDAAGDAKAGDAKAGDAKAGDAKAADPKKPAEAKAPALDGKPLYEAKCKVCHAADGKGTEAMKKNNIPDMTDKGWQGKHAKAAVVKAITDGIADTKMKSFKDKLKPEEIDAVAAYVKKLK